MKHKHAFLAGSLILFACSKSQLIVVTNPADFDRKGEVVEVSLDSLNTGTKQDLTLKDENGRSVPIQLIDLDQNGSPDQFVFQVDVKAGSRNEYYYEYGKHAKEDTFAISTYCRYVPERMGDFAWENDRVAFRMYGPECQRIFEAGDPAGLVSSGIDCWLKRVPYPIINKWYKKEATGGSYHQDDGEGLDNFTVGKSRGCGGTAIRNQDKFVFSENFYEWKVIANGPIRSIFELRFKPVVVNGTQVDETKRFTIDLENNLFRCDVSFTGANPVDTIGIGLALNNPLGINSGKDTEGWISYWATLDDSEMGMGIVVGHGKSMNVPGRILVEKDNYWLLVPLKENKLTYYAGFSWKKAGNFVDEADWISYLKNISQRSGKPLVICIQDD